MAEDDSNLPGPLANLFSIDHDTENRFIWERCIEIARECLADNAGRSVPDLDTETWQLFLAFDGADAATDREWMPRLADGGLPAFVVAARALRLADMAARNTIRGD